MGQTFHSASNMKIFPTAVALDCWVLTIAGARHLRKGCTGCQRNHSMATLLIRPRGAGPVVTIERESIVVVALADALYQRGSAAREG